MLCYVVLCNVCMYACMHVCMYEPPILWNHWARGHLFRFGENHWGIILERLWPEVSGSETKNLDRSSQPQPPIPTRSFGTILANVLDGIYAPNQLKIHNFVAGVRLNLTTPWANLGLVPFLLAPFRTAEDMPAIPPNVRVEELRGRRKQTMRSLAGRQGMGLDDSEDRSVEFGYGWRMLEDHPWIITGS